VSRRNTDDNSRNINDTQSNNSDANVCMRLPVKSLVCNCRILVAGLNNVTVLITPIQRWRADCVTAPRRSYHTHGRKTLQSAALLTAILWPETPTHCAASLRQGNCRGNSSSAWFFASACCTVTACTHVTIIST